MQELMGKERSYVFEARVSDAAACQKVGTQCYRDLAYEKAVECYDRALYHVDFEETSWMFELLDQHRDAVNKVRLPVYLNLSACYLQLKKFDKALKHAELALEIDSRHPKALYRGGMAHFHQRNADKAKKLLSKALVQCPNDAGIRRALEALKIQSKQHQETEKKLWKGAFASKTSPPSTRMTSIALLVLVMSIAMYLFLDLQ